MQCMTKADASCCNSCIAAVPLFAPTRIQMRNDRAFGTPLPRFDSGTRWCAGANRYAACTGNG